MFRRSHCRSDRCRNPCRRDRSVILLVVSMSIAGILPVRAVSPVHGAAAALTCRYGSQVVTKEVRGKLQRVRVCRKALHPLRVTSLIADSVHLSQPVEWRATVSGIGRGDAVQTVGFLIDGRTRWTQQQAPYTFNGDGILHPWILGSGSHRFQVKVTTTSSRTARSSVSVDIVKAQPVPKALQGDYQRTVTAADYARTASLVPPGVGRAPTGTWTLHWMRNGVIFFATSGAPGQTEAFTATADGKLTLYGPVNWLSPANMRGGFCESAPYGIYHWHANGASQVVIAASKTDVKCPDRDSVFSGTWSRS